MLVEVDTSIRGIALILQALTHVNLVDARADRSLADELIRRVCAPAGKGFVYTPDPSGYDRWTTFRVIVERTPTGEPLTADCEDQTAAYAAGAVLLIERKLITPQLVEVAITQPAPGEMAHAYMLLGGQVCDFSAFNGMTQPAASFYRRGETAKFPIDRGL